jgi:uncharacterized protein (DUF362 family)/Pyruvate/2-oxoacid:ferredoxin oxidoreductase delta subunit
MEKVNSEYGKKVYLASCDDYEYANVKSAVKKIFDEYGGVDSIVKDGAIKNVLVKPNLLMPRKPEEVTTTHPTVVKAVAELFISAGCTVTIADSCGGPYTKMLQTKLYNSCGMTQVAEETGAILNFDFESRETENEGNKFPVITPILDADYIISIAKLKTHGLAYYTGAVKNMFGTIPGLTKARFHSRYPNKQDFCNMLVNLCECIKPSFSIIDGIIGMEGQGPSGGRPKKAGLLIASTNPHAADLVGARVMGFDSAVVPTLSIAIKRGYIPKSAHELEYTGADPSKYEFKFIPPIKTSSIPIGFMPRAIRPLLIKLFVPYPEIHTDTCIGCGECVKVCPEQTIKIIDKKAVIDYSKCIKCYCCHELCPHKSIGFRRFVKK